MSVIEESALQSRRSQPEEWESLLAVADDAIPDSGNRTHDGVMQLWKEVDQLDQTRLDDNRYFALGHVICAFARDLHSIIQDETKADELVDEGVGLMRQDPSQPPAPTMLLGDANPVFTALLRSSAQVIPPPSTLLGNTLHASDQMRLHPADDAEVESQIETLMDSTQNPILDGVEFDMYGGMSILQLLAKKWAGKPLDEVSPTRRQEIFSKLKRPEVLRVIRGFSAMPLVTFDPPALLETHTRGFDAPVQPMNRQLDRQRQEEKLRQLRASAAYNQHNLRTERMVCPAATVPLMFPMMQGLAVRMLEQAYS